MRIIFIIKIVIVKLHLLMAQPLQFRLNEFGLNLNHDIHNQYLIIGFENSLKITYPQDKPLTKYDVQAEFENIKTKKFRKIPIKEIDGLFYIKPDSLGFVKLTIQTIDGPKERTIKTAQFEVVPRLISSNKKSNEKISKEEFKSQMGIYAKKINISFSGSCNLPNFEILRITNDNRVERNLNNGGKFEKSTIKIIANAEKEDIFIFRNITCKCPGDVEERQLDSLIFEID